MYVLITPLKAISGQGDANNDLVVDDRDFDVWFRNYSKIVSNNNLSGDFNSDTRVDGVDFVIWLTSYGKTIPQETSVPIAGEMWITRAEISNLPASGTAWDRMKSAANASWVTPNMINQDNKHNTSVLAAAFVYAKTGDTTLRAKARDGIIAAKRTADETTEWGSTNGVLSVGRQLGGYVIAADIIGLKNFDPIADTEFRNWLTIIRTKNIGTHGRWKSLTFTCENSANNWGTFACPSRLAASLYLGDIADVDRTANILRSWMGERNYYPADAPGTSGYFQPTANWTNTGATWACDSSNWKAINPECELLGINLNGAIVEDASRGGPCCTIIDSGYGYSWEVLQGIFVSLELLYRTGKYGNPYQWSNNALNRALNFLERNNWQITNVSSYVPWMANKRYGTFYPTNQSSPGRIMSWGDWLYQ